MMSTIESFFDILRDSESVFKGLNISENHPEFCMEWMNQYPVLFVSLKSVEALDFENAFEMLAGVISDLCKKFTFLETDEKVWCPSHLCKREYRQFAGFRENDDQYPWSDG